MRTLPLITTLLTIAKCQEFSGNHDAKGHSISLIPHNTSVDVTCYSDLNNAIYNVVPRTELSTMELHVTCDTKTNNVFRVVGDKPNPTFHCLEKITDVISWLGIFSKNVKSLDLSNNCINRINVIPELPSLTILNCRHNSIESIEDAAFEDLPKLDILDLSYNSLTGEKLRKEIFQKQCTSSDDMLNTTEHRLRVHRVSCSSLDITVLLLGHNNIQSLHPMTFIHLQKLRELHLNDNPLSIANPSTFTAIKLIEPLRVLHLSNLKIKTIPFMFFNGLYLEALYLNGNNLTEVPQQLSMLGNSLLYLNINDNPIRILNYDSFFGLINLREIEVAGMPYLTSVYEGTFSHLRSLEIVILSYNPHLSFLDEYAFMRSSLSQTSLKLVYLHGNNLKHLSKNLLPWSQLDVLELSGNQWACDDNLRWFLELSEKQSYSVLRNAGLSCTSPKWPNNTWTDIYNRTIRKFNFTQPPNLQYRREWFEENVMIITFLVAIVAAIAAILAKCAHWASQRRVVAAEDLHTLSASLKNDIHYTKLRIKPIYNI